MAALAVVPGGFEILHRGIDDDATGVLGTDVVPGMAVKLGNSPRAIKTLTTEPLTLMRFTPSANATGR